MSTAGALSVKALGGVRANKQLAAGLAITLAVLLFGLVGPLFVDPEGTRIGSAPVSQPPSLKYPLGTDTIGRQMLPVMVSGTPLTLRIGLIAGAIGLGVGIVFGFVAGYFGGVWDHLLRGVADVFITIPGLLVLIVIASSLRGAVSVNMEALVISSVAWPFPTRTIRAQVLSMRERPYVDVAKLSGMNGLEIIARELIPNLLPYLAASFVTAVIAAILASIGLEALGLGPQNEVTLGMTLYWSLFYTAIITGMWWWWAPPIVMIVFIFVGLFLISTGLDQIANPRLRRAAA